MAEAPFLSKGLDYYLINLEDTNYNIKGMFILPIFLLVWTIHILLLSAFEVAPFHLALVWTPHMGVREQMFFRVATLIGETAGPLALIKFFIWSVGWLLISIGETKFIFFIWAEFKLVLSHGFSKRARTVAIPQKYQGQRCRCFLHDLHRAVQADLRVTDSIPCSAALVLASPVLQVYFVWTKSLGEFPICLCVRVICGRHCTWSAALELEALDTLSWASVAREICLILSQVKESSGS